jgi:hypothetical protein
MTDILEILLIVLICWLLLIFLLNFVILHTYVKKIDNALFNMVKLFDKRREILLGMLDIIKIYDDRQFKKFNDKLYEYNENYDNMYIDDIFETNYLIDREVSKVLLSRDVYPYLKRRKNYVKLEGSFKRSNNNLKRIINDYNRLNKRYSNFRKNFINPFICKICGFRWYVKYDIEG